MEFASENQTEHSPSRPPSCPPRMTPEQRRRLRAWQKAHRKYALYWRSLYGNLYPVPMFPIIPVDLLGFPCGAKTRNGTVCQRIGRFPSGRCNLHGGKSTGPRTAAGKAASAANGRCPKRKGRVAEARRCVP